MSERTNSYCLTASYLQTVFRQVQRHWHRCTGLDDGLCQPALTKEIKAVPSEAVTPQLDRDRKRHTFAMMPQRRVVKQSFACLESRRRQRKNDKCRRSTSLQLVRPTLLFSSARPSYPRALRMKVSRSAVTEKHGSPSDSYRRISSYYRKYNHLVFLKTALTDFATR